ncbi:MAG: hypothetical protein EAX86_01345 [Candidatus Heimdallarchaeota archaeon]|nr:hypothetical protein [Candidatus Heimdallarchaeota archaeon]
MKANRKETQIFMHNLNGIYIIIINGKKQKIPKKTAKIFMYQFHFTSFGLKSLLIIEIIEWEINHLKSSNFH